MRIGFAIGMLGVLLPVCVPAAGAAGDDPQADYSDAQTALFRTPHLDNVTQPTSLEYEYRRQAGPDDSFVDTVTMTVTGIAFDGGKTVTFEYLTGSNHRPFGGVTDFRGNPLVMVFLEDDLRRMSADLGGGGVYMRNRIRHAFYERGQMQPVTFELDGRTQEGMAVTIAPFVGDKNRERLGDYERKVYEFVVSPAVPGGIFRMRSTVPSPSPPGLPLVEDSLTYRRSGAYPYGTGDE